MVCEEPRDDGLVREGDWVCRNPQHDVIWSNDAGEVGRVLCVGEDGMCTVTWPCGTWPLDRWSFAPARAFLGVFRDQVR